MAPDAAPTPRTAAVLVIYRLASPIEPTLASLRQCVATTIVVDNSEHGHPGLAATVAAHQAVLLAAGNRGGLAGAYNLALDHLRRTAAGPVDRVVFLDEDSDTSGLGRFLDDPQTRQRLAEPGTAAVAPAYREKATGLRGKYIALGRFRLNYLPRQFPGMRPVAFVINSMSVWRMQALERIGAFNEKLAIDHVDTEYCLRARRCGLTVWVHGDHEFAHSIGERRRYRFLGKELQAGGHAPARRYLIGRNTSWLARAWLWREPAFAFLCATRLAYELVGILVAEDQAMAKLAALVRGALAGLFMPSLAAARDRASP